MKFDANFSNYHRATMKQILQDLKSGETMIEDIPCPGVMPGSLLIRTSRSLISAGTERMLVDFGKAGYLDKARQQPDKVRMVLDKIKTDGLLPTIEAVQNKLGQPLPMGYCNVGTVLEVGANVTGFSLGDRVVSNGKHAEVVNVPKNLCARVPHDVSDDKAAFTVICAIALQGIRLANPTLGETVVVTGLGLIGLVTVQLLVANGCRVLGIDFDPSKIAMAKQLGAEAVNPGAGADPVQAAMAFSRGRGVDAVLITASTKSSEPVHQAALMCRKRGRIVLVGVAGLELSRADFFEKELTFQVSCSYGPGRYDSEYEEKGRDYPFGLVRWTEQRNFEAVLDLMQAGQLDPMPLVSHRFKFDNALEAYNLIGKGVANTLGMLLEYPQVDVKPDALLRHRTIATPERGSTRSVSNAVTVGFVGSGNYASQVLIPAFAKTSAKLCNVASAGGITSVHAAKKFGIASATTDTEALLGDTSINTIVITTRHNSHARFVCKALAVGKHVFVEKPLALRRDELDEIAAAYHEACEHGASPVVMVGFNRRFSPQVQKIKHLLAGVSEPKSFIMTVNAGAIPPDHWTQDSAVGGGRIIGEGCHFVDLLRFLAGAPIVSSVATMIGEADGVLVRDDKVSMTFSYADGSFGTVHYLANGHKSFPKERLEIFCAGRILQLDNFRRLRGYGWPKFNRLNLMRQDKGNAACVAAFVDAIKFGQPSPISFEELQEVSKVTFDVADMLN